MVGIMKEEEGDQDLRARAQQAASGLAVRARRMKSIAQAGHIDLAAGCDDHAAGISISRDVCASRGGDNT